MSVNNGPFIQLKDIAKRYDDGYLACSNININIDKGKFITILGPSGCGKTTLLKMLAGFEMPSNGKIIVNGIDIKDLPIHLRPTATVFQDYALFPNMNIYENICYGLKVMRTALEQVPDAEIRKLEKVKKVAIAKATKEIGDLKEEMVKIDKEILKAKLAYSKNQEIFKIQEMRYPQFQIQVMKYEKMMKERNPEFDGFKLSIRLQRKILRNRIDLKKVSKVEQQLYKLIRTYVKKQPIDRKVDKLLAKYNDRDQWISYWENYPQMVVEQYEKIHTTRPLTKKEIDKRAREAIELVGLTGSENKFPKDLSGGMQQRVALARAIVVKPDILLLDEPLSALDAKVRKKMQEELKRIHNELKINFILVTHDQEEALRLSDQVIVMSRGHVEQVGTPKNIYEHPSNEWVANFIGQANFVHCKYLGKNKVLINGKTITYPITNKDLEAKLLSNKEFNLLIRPEDVEICNEKHAYMMVRVVATLYKGTYYEVKCVDKHKNKISLLTFQSVNINSKIGIRWNFNYTTPIFEKKGKQ